jgi:uncharacterized membrane protein
LKIKLGSGLVPLIIVAILLVLLATFSISDVLRIIFGLPFVLFFPGYALILALFPSNDSIGIVERIALSFGLSIAVVPLIGLILNYTPWGIVLESVLYSITFFILAMSGIAFISRKKLNSQSRFNIEFRLKLPVLGVSVWDKILSIVLIIAILGAVGTLVYVIATPKVGERFTEFYVLGEAGKAADYPQNLNAGDEFKVTVGIINHEQETTSYRVEVHISGEKVYEQGPVSLENGEIWEQGVNFVLTMPGESQKVEFLLFKNEAIEPSQESLHLWIDVTD